MAGALGLIEVRGFAAAIAAADAALKAADVTLDGWELTKGGAKVLVKLGGEIGAVQAAVDAADAEAKRISAIVVSHVIPRPHDDLANSFLR